MRTESISLCKKTFEFFDTVTKTALNAKIGG